MNNENRENNKVNMDDIPDLYIDFLNDFLGEKDGQPVQKTEEPGVPPVEELIFGEEDKVNLFDDGDDDDDDLMMIFDDIETDLTSVNEEEDDDDLVFIDAVSVRDRRKINKIQMVEIPDELDVEKKKTRRRTHDVNEMKMEHSINFAKKNIVAIGIGILVLIIIIGVIVVGVKNFKENHSSVPKTSSGTESYQVKEQEAIEALMGEYFTALAENDTYVLNEILDPVFDNEMEYIRIVSDYIDSYNNIVCYASEGAKEGDYIVAAYYEVKYSKVRETAPGMQFFYVETNADGDLYLNNLYSEHNMVYVESQGNTEIMALMSEYQLEPDMQSMVTQVQDNYSAALEGSEGLTEMVTVTLPAALTDWAASMEAYLNVQPDIPVDDPGTTEEDDTPEPDNGIAETPAEGIVYTNDSVNVRQTPSTDAAKVASLYAGAEVTRLATTENGWTKVQTGDLVGYIRSDFISEEQPAGTGNAAGSTITVNDTLNIRASKSTEADLVDVVTPGGTITIVEGDSEGWTKVSYNGNTGYIRSDLLGN